MKKIFTLAILAAAFSFSAAADDVYYYELNRSTLDLVNFNSAEWAFTNCDIKWVPEGGRDTSKFTTRQNYLVGLNCGKGKVQTLKFPEGMLVYALEMFGYSQGDNWDYMITCGDWTDPIGAGVKDNYTIITQAKYPLDPCVIDNTNENYPTWYPADKFGTGDGLIAPSSHEAGYQFATVDFGNDPYEGEISFNFDGNNQLTVGLRVWVQPYDASKVSALQTVKAPVCDGIRYNVLGQKVGEDYQGLVIMNGKKYLVK